MSIENLTNAELGAAIQEHQRTQMTQPNSYTEEWEKASAALAPLFAEAAKRQQAGKADGIEPL